jgi:hypothetical protein
MFEIIKSPWENTFIRLLSEANTSVLLASPFIKLQTALLITKYIKHKVDFKYINSFKLAHFHTGASDLEALSVLKKDNCRLKNVHNLHAKLFVIDNAAIITSGNLTPGGLRNNLEYGILVKDKMVKDIKSDYLAIFNNPEYPEITNSIIDKAEAILLSVPKEKQKRIRITDKELFEEIINDEIIEERFEGGTKSIVSNLSPWEKDVFACLEKIENDVFTLGEAYSYEIYLNSLHPNNKNVQAKIRQQLQYLRDIGLVEFVKPGLYKKLWTK